MAERSMVLELLVCHRADEPSDQAPLGGIVWVSQRSANGTYRHFRPQLVTTVVMAFDLYSIEEALRLDDDFPFDAEFFTIAPSNTGVIRYELPGIEPDHPDAAAAIELVVRLIKDAVESVLTDCYHADPLVLVLDESRALIAS